MVKLGRGQHYIIKKVSMNTSVHKDRARYVVKPDGGISTIFLTKPGGSIETWGLKKPDRWLPPPPPTNRALRKEKKQFTTNFEL